MFSKRQDQKIKIYCDNGADIKYLKQITNIEFWQFPYDSNSRPPKLNKKLAEPSNVTWKDCHITWEEAEFAWGDLEKSSKYDEITKIVGKQNRQDILHLDSAYKSNCDIFITSDKGDISNKDSLEALLGYKIFYHQDKGEILKYIQQIRPA